MEEVRTAGILVLHVLMMVVRWVAVAPFSLMNLEDHRLRPVLMETTIRPGPTTCTRYHLEEPLPDITETALVGLLLLLHEWKAIHLILRIMNSIHTTVTMARADRLTMALLHLFTGEDIITQGRRLSLILLSPM
jgi:hypothetical protein